MSISEISIQRVDNGFIVKLIDYDWNETNARQVLITTSMEGAIKILKENLG